MADPKPWGGMDPNSDHQLWSEWTFKAYEGGRRIPTAAVTVNARRFMAALFGSVGRMKVETRLVKSGAITQVYHVITAQVEGVAAHDPGLVQTVRLQFERDFVKKGMGPLATSTVEVKILAGDQQDGKPRSQLVVLPGIKVEPEVAAALRRRKYE